MLTLTLRAVDSPLRDQLKRLYTCFRQFRHYKDVRPSMHGGLYFLELTLNSSTRLWHPHLHVLFEGAFLPHELAKLTWLQVTGDSYIVDVRKIGDSGTAAGYVSKYASKSLDSRVWHDPERLAEAMVSLHGRRTFQTFGTWTALGLSKVSGDLAEWSPVAPLWRVLDLANAGDTNSIRIIHYLTTRSFQVPFELKEPFQDTS